MTLRPKDSTDARAIRDVASRLADWKGPIVADLDLTRDEQNGLSLEKTLKASRRAGIRNVVVVSANQDRDSITIHASLFDAGGDSVVKTRRVSYARADSAGSRKWAARLLVSDLLRDGTELPWKSSTDSSFPSLAAWRLYDQGRASLSTWSLANAERAFRDALATDNRHALANLWLSQTLTWMSDKPSLEAGAAASRAVELGMLSLADSIYAEGLRALSSQDFPKACGLFKRMLTLGRAGVETFIGAGDCLSQDRAVVIDERDQRRYVFRGSFEAAARAYLRASGTAAAPVESAFSGWLLSRLSTVLYTVTNRVRLGQRLAADSETFGALPFIDHDTIAFAPYPAGQLALGDFDPAPGLVEAVVRRNREILRHVCEAWVRAAPRNAAALDSLASWTEVSGGVARVDEKDLSTVEILSLARAAARDPAQLLHIKISEVRLLVKAGRFQEAKTRADSVWRESRADRATTSGMIGIAGLLGHVEPAADLLASSKTDLAVQTEDGRFFVLRADIAASAARLSVFAAFGAPADSIRTSASRALSLIRSAYPDSATAEQLAGALIAPSIALSFPNGIEILQTIQNAPDRTTQGFALLSSGDRIGAKLLLLSARRLRKGKQIGSDFDRDFRRARLALALGDTSTASLDLDRTLRALPLLGTSLFEQFEQITTLVRAFALRAEIAQRQGDPRTAREYATIVATLWKDADPSLQPLVRRMSSLAALQ